VIVGDIGYRDHVVFTALGDPVNVAARLQDMTKDFACEAVIAEDAYRNAGLPPDPASTREVNIRGRDRPLTVRLAQGASLVPAMAT
jgi:adenylate cyclase